MPKETSRLYQYAKNSEEMEKWILENYDKIKNGEKPNEDSIEFPIGWQDVLNSSKRGLYATTHNADMHGAKILPDGTFTAKIGDLYDYDKWDLKHT